MIETILVCISNLKGQNIGSKPYILHDKIPKSKGKEFLLKNIEFMKIYLIIIVKKNKLFFFDKKYFAFNFGQ